MGKPKNKKKAKTTVPEASEQVEENCPTGSAGAQAMDGHNVDGWTESQIAAYNELLLEREKLEKQRKELEIKSAKSHAGRALLNENVTNIDSVFKLQKPTGDYRYSGINPCCVELSLTEPCHHEICARSQTEGVSYNELDTIKYYAMRIPAEKTERRRDALRKQRDAELTKIKREEAEDRAASVRKSAARNKPASNSLINTFRSNLQHSTASEHDRLVGNTKDTQRLVTNILEQLDDLRMDLQAGRISTTDMQKKLDTIDERMQAAQLKPSKISPAVSANAIIPSMSHQDIMSSTKAFQDHIKDRIINTKGDTYSKAFHIMEHFLSASKPGDFQAAVSELKDVLRLSGPMGHELQKSFDALEGIFDSPDRLSFPGPDGKQECSSIIDLMAKMKDTLQRTGQLPEGANSELVSVFEECIKLETDGRAEMVQEFKIHTTQTVSTELESVLSRIKSDMVAKSPIPPLTEQKLGDEMQMVLDTYDARRLMFEVKVYTTESQLDGLMTRLVMNRAQKIPGKYVESIERLARAYERLREGLQDQTEYQELDKAFPRVKIKMEAFVAKLADKKAVNENPAAPRVIEATSVSPKIPEVTHDTQSDGASDYEDKLPPDVHEVIQAAVEKFVNQNATSVAHLKLRTYITEHGQMGLWPLWLAWSEDESIDEDLELQDKALECEDCTSLVMNDDSQGLKMAVVRLYDAGMCPGMSAGVISQLITDTVDLNPDLARSHMRQLADCIQGLPAPVTQEWSRLFQHLALAMTQLYVALYTNASLLFPKISPLHFGISSMSMVVSYICLTRSKEGAMHNFRLIWTFVNTCMSSDGIERAKEFYDVARHFLAFCDSEKYRCLTLEPCSAHMAPAVRLKTQIHLPESSKVGTASESAYRAIQNPESRHAGRSSSESAALTLIEITEKERERQTVVSDLLPHFRHPKPSTTDSARRKSTHSLRYANVVARANRIFESTARKALALMQLGIDDWIVDDLERSHDIMADVPQLTDAGINPVGILVSDDGTKPGQSKFSEHLDELPFKDLASAQSMQILQNLHEARQFGKSYFEWSEEISSRIKDEALSGRWPDPTYRIRRIIDKFSKMSYVPEILMATMGTVQDDVERMMQLPDVRRQFETRRFDFWLSAVQAQAPTIHALYDLARGNNGTFEDYCALLASVKAEQGQSIEQIRNLCSEALDLAGNSTLTAQSRCIVDLAKVALQDWTDRGQSAFVQQADEISKSPSSHAIHLNGYEAKNPEGYSAKSEFVDAVPALSVASVQSSLASFAHADLSSNTEISFKSAVSQTSVIDECNDILAEEQSVELDCDLEDLSANENDSSDDFSELSELSRTDTVTQANLPAKHLVTNGSSNSKESVDKVRGQDEKHVHNKKASVAGTDMDLNKLLNPITRDSIRQMELITQLVELCVSVNKMKTSDLERRKKLDKPGELTTENYKVFERVTASHEARLMISRDIAATIAETRNYKIVKAYLGRGYAMGHQNLW